MPDTARATKAADAIADHIEALILEGALRPGEKLVAERELAEKLDVSRPTLRDAIAKLSDKGLLQKSRGGTRVAPFLSPLMEPLAALLSDKPHVTDDYFEFRRCLEAEAAGLAALRATELDRELIGQCADRMKKAHAIDDPTEEAEADVDLHLLIYEASHNVVLMHVLRAMAEMLRKDVFYNREQLYLRPGVRDLLLNQHLAMADAILAGKSENAKNAAADHIRFTYETIKEIRRSSMRLESSLHRIARIDLISRQN